MPRPTPCQEIVDLLPFEEFDLHLGIVGQAFPPILPQFVLELGQLAPRAWPADNGADSPRKANDSSLIMPRSMTQIRRDLPNCVSISDDNGLDGLQVSGVAGERAVGQREAVAGHNQRDDDLLAIAAVIAGIASVREFVLFSQPLEVRAGKVVEYQAVIELEQGTQPFFQIAFDRSLTPSRRSKVRYRRSLVTALSGTPSRSSRPVEAYQCSASANSVHGYTEAVDHLDGHDIGRTNGLLALRNVSLEDLVELEVTPQPEPQPDVAESARIGPTHRFQADPDDVGIIGQVDLLVVREEAELTIFSLSIVKHDGALPAAFLVMVELSEVGDDPLSWPGLGANAFHQGVVGVCLAVIGAAVAS